MASRPAQSRSARPAQRAKEDGDRRQREEFRDYAQARHRMESFDPAAWETSVAQREQMPAFTARALDPGPEAIGKRRSQAGLFVADDSVKATVRATKPGVPELGFIRAVNITSERELTPGTLMLPVTAEDLGEVHPTSLRLFRWDEAAERYELQPASGLNVEGGYAWGRVTSPGRYALFGMPLQTAIEEVGIELVDDHLADGLLHHLAQLVSASFSPSEPWQSLGPTNLSCCIRDLALDPRDGDCVYAAADTGGVWRLDSVRRYPHETWMPLTDQQPSLKVTAVAVCRADSNLIYYADTAGRLFRSVNRGYSWEQAGSTTLGTVNRILTHPTDSNRVYAASSTGFWSSPSRGTNWDRNVGQTTLLDGNISDAEIDPAEPSIIYVGQRGVGVVKTSDGGATWRTVLTWSSAATPVDNTIKVAVGGQGTPTTRTVAAKLDQEVFISRTAGESTPATPTAWSSAGKHGGTGQGSWNSVIAVDPNDDNVIFAGAQELHRRDAQGNWTRVVTYYAPHEDQHRVLFDRAQPNVVYLANDGGVFRSIDRGVTWQTQTEDDILAKRDLTRGLVTAQLFAAGISQGRALANAMHQGLLGSYAIGSTEWIGVEGHSWEVSHVVGDPSHPGRHYLLNPSILFRRIFPNPASGDALAEISKFSPTTVAPDPSPGIDGLLAGTADGKVMRTLNSTQSPPVWTEMPGISLSGGDRVVSIAFAPATLPQQAYALTDVGRVFICEDVYGAIGWREVKGLPSGGAKQIVANPGEARQIFAIASTQAYRSVNASQPWEPIQGTAPNALPASSRLVAMVPRPEALYLAAQSGVYMSPDRGQNWFPEMTGLPNVEITGLLWEKDDLFAITYGRGLWHRRRYLPPLRTPEHGLDAKAMIELWKMIHGGDPPPDLMLSKVGISVLTLQAQRRARASLEERAQTEPG